MRHRRRCFARRIRRRLASSIPEWALTTIAVVSTAVKLAKARKSSIALIPYVTPKKAKELVETAKKSVASATDQITEQIIKATVKQIKLILKSIETQTKIMADKCSVHEVKLLKTFNGISDFSAIGLILEIGSVERFA